MATVLFIDEQYFKDFSIVNDNTDMKILTPTIEKVQDMRILPILGTALYNEIKTQINADDLSTENQTLLEEYVQKAMLWWVLYECPPVFVYRFMNKGVMKKSSDNSSSADLAEINFLMDRFKNDAEWYSERITLFLCQNSADYPLYNNPGSGADTIAPNASNFETPFFLDDVQRDYDKKAKFL